MLIKYYLFQLKKGEQIMRLLKKVLAVALTVGIIASVGISASALENTNNNKSKELGYDQNFLNNQRKARRMD